MLGVYLCQRWIVEYNGIMQPVLFLIFFTDFVTPEKCTISEGCWLWHTPGYQQKFWPKTQFLKITGSGLNLELDAVLVILKTKFYKKKMIFDTPFLIWSLVICLARLKPLKIDLFQNPILFCKHLGPLLSHRNGSVCKMCVWISVFRRKQAQLRLCKLGPGTVLIFYKSLSPTPIYI